MSTSMLDDWALYDRARMGDATAAEELVGRHTPRMKARCRSRRLREDDAEVVIQDTWMAVFCGPAPGHRDSPFKAWLMGILEHKIADHYRKLPPGMSGLDACEDPAGGGPQAWTEPEELLKEIDRILWPDEAFVVKQRGIYGWRYCQIGAKWETLKGNGFRPICDHCALTKNDDHKQLDDRWKQKFHRAVKKVKEALSQDSD